MNFINLHTHRFTDNPEVLEIINQYPNEFSDLIPQYSIGIHPWYIPENPVDFLETIRQKLPEEQCLALGECGLDKRIETDLQTQINIFEQQLDLAEQFNKPVILHIVAAFQELIAIKKQKNISVPMVVHGFSGSLELAQQLLKNGFYLSFGKYLLRNPHLKEVFQSIPNDRFFLETDTIEEGILLVYDLAAQYKNVTLPEIQNIIKNNFNTVFKNGRVD